MQLDMLKLLVEHGVDINFQFTLFGDKDKLFKGSISRQATK